jgi:hypothetical protein
MEMKYVPILILLFGCARYLLLESEGDTQFQFLFGRMNHGIRCFVSTDELNTENSIIFDTPVDVYRF